MNYRSSFFPSVRAGVLAGVAVAALIAGSIGARAQVTGSTQTTTDAAGQPQETVTMSAGSSKSSKKDEKVVPSKDTKKRMQETKKADAVAEADVVRVAALGGVDGGARRQRNDSEQQG